MAELQRAKPTEYFNPRPLVLGVCFFWGIAVGFCLFYFSPPAQLAALTPASSTAPAPGPGPLSELERRNQDVPVIAEVAASLGQQTAVPAAPELETMDLDPPAALLTTDGGLTGKMARPLRTVPPGAAGAAASVIGGAAASPGTAASPAAPAFAAPPPIPELLP